MAYAAGVDVGSTQTKAIVIDEAKNIVGRALIDTGANVVMAAEQAFAQALKSANVEEEEVEYVIGTGYGRYRVTFGNSQVTEISCHGRGAVHMFPATRTVIDMGGQDTEAIRVRPSGEIVDFCMNDKCAAGTGDSWERRPVLSTFPSINWALLRCVPSGPCASAPPVRFSRSPKCFPGWAGEKD